MEFSKKNWGQWGLLLLLVIGVFLYRELSRAGDQVPNPQALATRQEEMAGMWDRIPGYLNKKPPEPLFDATAERIISERVEPSDASYEQVRDWYEKELLAIGWLKVGEAKDAPGFASPIFIFHNGDYDLFLNKEPEGILLRMVWNAKADVLFDARVKK
jgi:hypothetical protein